MNNIDYVVVIPIPLQVSISAPRNLRHQTRWEILLPVCLYLDSKKLTAVASNVLCLDPGTQSGGDNWIGYLTTQYNTSLVLSYSLAIVGATIDNSIATWGFGDMTSQVAAFQSNYASKPASAPWTANNTIVSFWVGINE